MKMKTYRIKPKRKTPKKKQKGGFISTIGRLKSYYDMYNHGRAIYDDGKNIAKTIFAKNSLAKKVGTAVEGAKRIHTNIKGLKSANERRKYWGGGKKNNINIIKNIKRYKSK